FKAVIYIFRLANKLYFFMVFNKLLQLIAGQAGIFNYNCFNFHDCGIKILAITSPSNSSREKDAFAPYKSIKRFLIFSRPILVEPSAITSFPVFETSMDNPSGIRDRKSVV